MRGIVTGGAGFLGSHVADVLAEQGHDVTVLDASPTSRHRQIQADLLDLPALEAAFRNQDFICHLAAVGDVYLAMEKPYLAAAVNVTGTTNVCQAAVTAHVGRVVYASTWEVYGEPSYQPIDEQHPTAPDHPYSITKLAGERMAFAYTKFKELEVVALRLGTAFGTRMRPNSVFSIFARKALAGEPITIQGSGSQGRQFTHARDIASAFALAITKGEPGAVYNTVSDDMISIRQLAETVASIAPTNITYAPARMGDVPSAVVTSKRAQLELGWRPVVRFRDGLEEIIGENRTLLVSAR